MTLETDYLVVGAGALGMAFVDTLIEHSDADVVMVERRHRPGRPLAGLVSVRAAPPAVAVLRRQLDPARTGPDRARRQRTPASTSEPAAPRSAATSTRSCATGSWRRVGSASSRCATTSATGASARGSPDQVTDVTVRRRVVDATYMASRVPATDPPPFDVADGVRCVPVGELTTLAAPGRRVRDRRRRQDRVGRHLLAARSRDAIPTHITWIRPRDSWMLNRAFFQPGQPPHLRRGRSRSSRRWSRRSRWRRCTSASRPTR